jgi:hypothetical protein
MTSLRRALLMIALSAAAGCGGANEAQPPVETLLYVSGANVSFTLPMNDPACPADSSGIQAPNANHQFGDRLFETPHLFVLENIQQPVQAVIKNVGDQPLRADLYLGLNPQVSNFVIAAGECRKIAVTSLPQPTPNPQGFETRVEVCSPMPTPGSVDLDTSCIGTPPSNPPPPDGNIAFFSNLGDIAVSHITNCILMPILDACRTPSTMFLEEPKDEVDAIMSVNSGQRNGVVRLELYLNDVLVGVDGGSNPVVSETL